METYFSILKSKRQKAYRAESNEDILLSTLASMLTYKDLPETVDTNFMELYKLLNGCCAIWKLKEEWIVTRCNLAGDPDYRGIGKDAICTTDNGVSKTFKDWINNPDIAVFFNDNLYGPDMSVGVFTDLLTETETSIKSLIMWSRMSPLPIASDEKTKASIDTAVKNIFDGKLTTILNEDILSQITDGNGINVINLTHPEASNNIQYLCKLRDDIFRWFYSLNGMNSAGSSKMAQQTTDEVNQDSNASMIRPDIRLRQAMHDLDIANKKFGWNASVSLSECWMNRKATFDDEFSITDEELENDELEPEEPEEPEKEEVKDNEDDQAD